VAQVIVSILKRAHVQKFEQNIRFIATHGGHRSFPVVIAGNGLRIGKQVIISNRNSEDSTPVATVFALESRNVVAE